MRKTILAAVAASAITGAVAGSAVQPAQAQQRPDQPMQDPGAEGPGAMMPGPGPHGPGMMHGGMMHDGMGGGMWHPGWWHWKLMQHMAWMHHHGQFAPGTFALFDRHVDRHLTPPDVVKIAQGLLLWFGNHTWQVGDVVENSDWVGFAFTAPDGTVIARFTMDRHNGHIARVG